MARLQQLGRHDERQAHAELPHGLQAERHDLRARAVVHERVHELPQHRRQHLRRHQLMARLRRQKSRNSLPYHTLPRAAAAPAPAPPAAPAHGTPAQAEVQKLTTLPYPTTSCRGTGASTSDGTSSWHACAGRSPTSTTLPYPTLPRAAAAPAPASPTAPAHGTPAQAEVRHQLPYPTLPYPTTSCRGTGASISDGTSSWHACAGRSPQLTTLPYLPYPMPSLPHHQRSRAFPA